MTTDLSILDGSPPQAPRGRRGTTDLSVLDSDMEQRGTILRSSIGAAVQTPPEQAGKVRILADKTGLPPSVIEGQEDRIDQQQRVNEIYSLAKGDAVLSRRLSDPEFAKIAQDDVAHLSRVRKTIGATGEWPAGRGASGYWGNDGEARPLERGFLQGLYEPILRGVAQAAQGRLTAAREMGIYKNKDAEFAAQFKQRERRIESYPTPPEIQKGLRAIAESETMGEAVAAAFSNPNAVWEVTKQSIGSSSGSIGLALVGSIFGPGGTAAGAGSGSFFIEYTSTIKDVLAEKGMDASRADHITQAFNDPQLMSEAREKGVRRGIPIAVFDAISGGFAGSLIRGARQSALSVGSRVVGEMGIQAGAGAAGEATAQALTGEYKPGDILLEALAEIPTGLAEARGNLRYARVQAERNAHAEQVEHAAEVVKKLFADTPLSKLRERSPATYTEFINEAAADGPLPAVYVNAAVFAQGAQQAGINIAQQMPETAAALEAAVAVNGDVRIPLGELAAAIPGTTFEQTIIPLLRTDPNGPTQAEAKDAAWVEDTKAQTEKILNEQQADDAWKQGVEEVRVELAAQLKKTNRFTADVNEAYAGFVAAFFAANAARMNMTPQEMLARYPLQTRSDAKPGAVTLDQAPEVAQRAAAAYAKKAGLKYTPVRKSVTVDKGRAARIAAEYDKMAHAPNDPVVKAAYRAMIDETLAQWQIIKETGLKVEFIKPGQADPYAASPRMAIDDVRQNNHLWVFPTDQGFGSDTWTVVDGASGTIPTREAAENIINLRTKGNSVVKPMAAWEGYSFRVVPNDGGVAGFRIEASKNGTDVSGNPLLEKTSEVVDGRELLANDVFRIVHDYFGHIKDNNGFRAGGEENAWRSHSTMYSPLARRAMTSETRGQNSWVNFGPYGETNRTAKSADTHYAPQKTGLLPEWVSTEGSPEQDGVSIRPQQADAVLRDVVHYSHAAGLNTLEGARNGTGINGAERERLNTSKDARIKQRVYFYEVDEGVLPQPEVGLGIHTYRATLSNLYDFGDDPRGILDKVAGIIDREERANALESAVIDAGFDGYTNNSMVVVLGGDVPVQYAGEAKRTFDQSAVQDFIDNLTPAEQRKVKGKLAERIAEHMAALPSADEMAAVAYAGRAKRGWYSESAQAIAKVFGPDAPQFAQLLAAMSPQTSVESNLRNALNVWAGWIEAGRPREREAIIDIMAANVEGNGSRESVLNAWINNSVMALQYDEDVVNNQLSGAKVNSFYLNLISELEEVTLDTWMANYALVEQTLFSTGGPIRPGSKIKGKGTGYIAFNARVREAAKALTEYTGEEWQPAEVQETVWSWAKTLYELSTSTGASAVETLKAGELTHNLINSTPDFGSLFNEPEYAAILREAGYGDELDTLASNREDIGRQPGDEDFVAAEAGPFTAKNQRRFELAAAKRLDELREKRNTLEQSTRGQITFGNDITQQPSVISLLANADLSTFLHESGHFFLEVLNDMAAQENAPQGIKDDFAKTLAWFGVTADQWRAMTLEQKRPYHEQWARGVEAYLFEGNSPSVELQSLFTRFRAWMLNVYRQLTALNVELTDEVRGVMDRMLATNEEIVHAETVRGYSRLFQTKPAGMDDAAWADYQQADDGTEEAVAKMQARSLRDMAWATKARSDALKRISKDATQKRNAVRAEVADEVAAEPVYRALRWVRKGEYTTAEGEEIKATAGHRFNTAAIAEMYPATGLANPDLTKLRGLTSATGMHPDDVAAMFDGFQSGDALVRAIVDAEPQQQKVDGITDQRMLERYGDLADPASIERAANEAVHNDVRGRAIATELSAVDKAVGNRTLLMQAARAHAQALISKMKLRDLKMKAYEYSAADARAARNAQRALAKDDIQAVAVEKRNQLVNFYAAKAANEAIREQERGTALLRKVLKGKEADIAKTRDVDVVMAARAVLAEYGIGTKGKAAQDYLKSVRAYDPGMYDVLRDRVDVLTVNAKELRELTLDEFRALRDEIGAMMHLARRSRQMEVDGDLMDRQDVAAELRARMEVIGIPDVVPGEGKAVTDSERRLMMFQSARAALRRVEAWVGAKDGDQAFGPFRRYIWQQVKDAADRYRADKAVHIKKYHDLVAQIAPSLKPMKIDAPELGYSFGHSRGGSGMAEILHAILHTGNESNKRKLLLGREWATQNADGSLDTSRWDAFVTRITNEGRLTKAHYDFAQGVWDTLEALKPLAQKTHRDVFGHYFAEITATPVVTPFGVYAGGYVPAIADPEAVTDAKTRALMEQENQSLAHAFPSTSKGFTKGRVEYNRKLLLDLRYISQHIDKVLLFSHLEQPVRDVRRVLTAKGVGSNLSRIDPAAFDGLLTPWLNRTALQQVETPIAGSNGLMKFFSGLRSRTGMLTMFANVSNTVQQILSGPITAAVKVGPKHLLGALADFTKGPLDFAKTVHDSSPYMATRMENEVAQLSTAINEILLNPTLLERGQAWTAKHAYFLQTAADNILSPIVWTGAYNQALEQGVPDADARRLADTAVRETQGATLPEEISNLESGNTFVRLFTQFAGYFNGQANMLGTEFAKVAEGVGLRKGAGRALYIFLFGFLLPAWISEGIAQAFRGGPDDEDKDGSYLDDWLAAVFGFGTLRYGTAMVPIFGQTFNAAANMTNNKPYDDRISTAPAISMIESTLRAPFSVYNAIAEDGKPGRAIKDTAAAASLLLGLPLYAAARPVSYLADVSAGRVEPSGVVDAARGTITGAVSPESKR